MSTNRNIRVILWSSGMLFVDAPIKGRWSEIAVGDFFHPEEYISEQDHDLIRHFVTNADAFLEDRIALKSGLVGEVEAFVRVGIDPETRAVRCYREG